MKNFTKGSNWKNKLLLLIAVMASVSAVVTTHVHAGFIGQAAISESKSTFYGDSTKILSDVIQYQTIQCQHNYHHNLISSYTFWVGSTYYENYKWQNISY